MARPRPHVAHRPTEAVCLVCGQTAPLLDVTAVAGSSGEYTGRFVSHERNVTEGKPPRRCPATIYLSHPGRYDPDD